MKMYYFQGKVPNFGDELNAWMWPKLLGDVFDQDDSEIFVGIGSILDDRFPATARKLVLGAGYGGYRAPPPIGDGSWDIHFVRGPQTVEKLGLDPSLAITDAAILIRTQELPPPAPEQAISFMPHFESLERGRWREVCATAGIQMIDPTLPVETVISLMRGTKLLLTEAMHGAIVGDALRVPWIPLRPIVADHRFKWVDWARSVELAYEPVRLSPSSTRETWIYVTGKQGKGPYISRLVGSPAGALTDRAAIRLAAHRLLRVAREQRPFLSRDSVVQRVTDRAHEVVARFRQRHAAV